MLITLFGPPGTGKNFVGDILASKFGFKFYDADSDLTPEIKRELAAGRLVTDEMREEYFQRATEQINSLLEVHPDVAYAQVLARERDREIIRDVFPNSLFVLVVTENALRRKRLYARKEHVITPEYGDKVAAIFEPPQHSYRVLYNNEGEELIVNQLEGIL